MYENKRSINIFIKLIYIPILLLLLLMPWPTKINISYYVLKCKRDANHLLELVFKQMLLKWPEDVSNILTSVISIYLM